MNKLYPVHTVLTHASPHLDEDTAIWLLEHFGGNLFPGIRTAKLVFEGVSFHSNGKSGSELIEEGIMSVAIPGAFFDEHPERESGVRRLCSVATLVAEHLGCAKDL